MPEAHKLSDRQRTKIHELKAGGATIDEIAKKFDVSHSTITYHLYKKDAPSTNGTSHKGIKHTSAKAIETMRHLRSTGMTVGAIGKRLGYSMSRVHYWLKKKPAPPHMVRKIQPIVLGAETVADVDNNRYGGVLDILWSHLSVEDKLRAIEALKE